MSRLLTVLFTLSVLTVSMQAKAIDPIRIGVLTDLSGMNADLSGKGSVEAAKMAVDDFGGKVLGRTIEVISADHQNKTDIGSAIVRKWIDQENVKAVVDVPTSSVALAVQDLTRQANIAFLISTGGSSDLTGKHCSPSTVQWTYDTYALANGTGRALTESGEKTWYFLTANYAFGSALQRDTTAAIEATGGKVLGSVRHPLGTIDFSSFLLQAQSSKAQMIALANSSGDTTAAIKQANEFGLITGGQKLASLLMFISDVDGLGLDKAQGLLLTTGFYWDMDEKTRAWSKRFAPHNDGKMPTMAQAGVYSVVLNFLKGVEASGSLEGEAVVGQMRDMKIDDMFARNAYLRVDGRLVHDMYLAQVKTPSESKGRWDYYKILRTIPGDKAFRPLAEGGCPLVDSK
ncbi:ABC transporter substrate-binding protein [Pusillimonas sp. ANT_WB101]|uniref:ABC transporter substrate-binding protein n=1 Tax=Pusillimonas sp. ANT_WB101 TaxID=2597356 RepID=UPI0011ECC1CA|nr:ABC transporter substrate-binding protein [Pusillimonas sp. ANT_WB101]KAA0890792.1 ABC transporter substrate-binding protein [Pusillimonas sp. ANT_WB101]